LPFLEDFMRFTIVFLISFFSIIHSSNQEMTVWDIPDLVNKIVDCSISKNDVFLETILELRMTNNCFKHVIDDYFFPDILKSDPVILGSDFKISGKNAS